MCQGGNKSRDIRGQQCRAWWRWCPYDSQIPRNDALHNSFMWPSYGIHMGVESCESKVVKEVPELGPVLWPYRKRYLTKKSPLAQLSRYRLCRLNIFTCQLVSRIWNPFEDLATNRKLPLGLRITHFDLRVESADNSWQCKTWFLFFFADAKRQENASACI